MFLPVVHRVPQKKNSDIIQITLNQGQVSLPVNVLRQIPLLSKIAPSGHTFVDAFYLPEVGWLGFDCTEDLQTRKDSFTGPYRISTLTPPTEDQLKIAESYNGFVWWRFRALNPERQRLIQ